MTKIAKDLAIEIHYTLTLDDGTVADSSDGREPLGYLHGHSNIIAGLERALEGRSVGDSLKVTVKPVDGYGEYNEELLQEVPRSAFQEDDELEVGMAFHAADGQGQPMIVRILKVEGNSVTIDGNMELAGKTLHFAVRVESIRDATAEELESGHLLDPEDPAA